MIKVEAIKNNRCFELKIEGHAMYKGTDDIVCAAASILYYSLLAAAEKDKGITKLRAKSQKGRADISFKSTGKDFAAFNMATEGFRLLCRQYPENVNFEKKEGR